MINLRNFLRTGRHRQLADSGDWRIELRPVRVDGHHNLHAIYCRDDGTTTSKLLARDLSRSQMHSALAAAMRALTRHFADDPGQTR